MLRVRRLISGLIELVDVQHTHTHIVLGTIADGITRLESIVSTNQDKINALADQLEKVREEVTDAVDDLKAQANRGEELDFSRLEAAVQSLDDLNADAVPEPEPAPAAADVPAATASAEPAPDAEVPPAAQSEISAPAEDQTPTA